MLQNAYFLAKIGADTAENEQHLAEILPKILPKIAKCRQPSCFLPGCACNCQLFAIFGNFMANVFLPTVISLEGAFSTVLKSLEGSFSTVSKSIFGSTNGKSFCTKFIAFSKFYALFYPLQLLKMFLMKTIWPCACVRACNFFCTSFCRRLFF